jgi:hypothetical protein
MEAENPRSGLTDELFFDADLPSKMTPTSQYLCSVKGPRRTAGLKQQAALIQRPKSSSALVRQRLVRNFWAAD